MAVIVGVVVVMVVAVVMVMVLAGFGRGSGVGHCGVSGGMAVLLSLSTLLSTLLCISPSI